MTDPASPMGVKSWFYGPLGVRAGWRLIAYTVPVLALFRLERVAFQRLHLDEVSDFVLQIVGRLLTILAASAVAARLERRSLAIYGLPWRRALRGEFWRGAAVGIASITVLLGIFRAIGVFHFGPVTMRGVESIAYGAVFAAIFLVIGLVEEFHFRGYGQYTLATGVRFWPAAIVTSLLFAYAHTGNRGETWYGVSNVFFGGLLFALFLRRTGSLWYSIGWHAAWDWGQSFLYGVPDSGAMLPGHVFNPRFSGPSWITGGTVGPEGSVLCTALIVVLFVGFWRWGPKRDLIQ